MTDLKTALWCDLTTDAERSAWLLLGRGYETGVVAKSMQNDLARAYQRLAQPVSEPVAWLNSLDRSQPHAVTGFQYLTVSQIERGEQHKYIPVYAAPQREWQGLTDEEIGTIIGESKITLINYCSANKQTEYARVIEQTLKDKNT